MSKVISIKEIPGNSIILKDFGRVDYQDTYKAQLRSQTSVDLAVTNFFKRPKWVNALMSLRNAIVKVFGLKAGGVEDAVFKQHYAVGDRAVLFTVSDRNSDEIVMAENDKHLNFRTSLFVEPGKDLSSVFLSTIVHYNNFFGRFYFFFVRPFHKLIVKSMLKRYVNEINKAC